MSSAALRQIFAEFGFKVDSQKLDALDAQVKAAADNLRDATVANTDFDKVLQNARGPKTAADALKAWGAEQKAAADKLKTLGGILERGRDDFAGQLGASAAKSNPLIRAFAERLNLTEVELGKMVMGATAAAVAVAALGVHAAFAFGTQFAANAEALRDTARESRVTTSELQGLDHAAVQAGVGVERMRSGLHTFGEALRQGERWGNGTTSTLRRLGITTRDAAGHIRPTAELLDEVAVGMERIESPYRRARVAQQLFGESGRRMLDVLHTGPGGIRQLREELEELGGGVTPEAVEASRRFTQAQERQGRALDSVRSVIATSLLPALSWWMNLTARAAGELAKLTRGTHVADIALGALGVAGVAAAGLIIAAWAPVVAPFVLAAAAVALVGLILDDVIGFMEGKESAVGRFLDTVFGEGTSTEAIDALRGSWAGVKDILDQVDAALGLVTEKFEQLRTLAAPVLSTLNRVGGYLPGGETIVGAQVGEAGPAAPADTGFAAGIERPVRGRPGQAVRASAGPTQAVPAPTTITVPASGFAGIERPVRQVSTTHNHGDIHVHGITDPARVAQEVDAIQQRRAREQRDAGHPQEDAD